MGRGPYVPPSMTWITPLALVWLNALAKVRHGVGRRQLFASDPVLETYVSQEANAGDADTARHTTTTMAVSRFFIVPPERQTAALTGNRGRARGHRVVPWGGSRASRSRPELCAPVPPPP